MCDIELAQKSSSGGADRMTAELFSFYARPGPMTVAGRHAPALAGLADTNELAKCLQGVLLHEHWAGA
jgi:hypothetical protein